MSRNLTRGEEAYLVVDKQIVDQVSLSHLPYTLMASSLFTTFATQKSALTFILFLEIVNLNYSIEKFISEDHKIRL